ncbi:MAG: alternative ribosome rescue aminoacyl-tRNA hydrolase ArfB [Chloroflexota bacterium]|nr:alternative ribosome rescue aminoacyl-tRNA hydrolase ArfB [Chloroflexota bacterium]MDE2884960.1 alternative ribosome rescue aminoacyl-tRNA hydrolase ArfB [Chloroflexota bacterium]
MIPVTDDISLAEHELEFHYVTSAGPGGQNVNKVATAAHLHFNAAASPSLPEDVKRRLRSAAGRRLTPEGVLVIKAQRYRSQERNRDDAVERLLSILRTAAVPPRQRRTTRPSQASVEQRLAEKRRRGTRKQSRSSLDGIDEEE